MTISVSIVIINARRLNFVSVYACETGSLHSRSVSFGFVSLDYQERHEIGAWLALSTSLLWPHPITPSFGSTDILLHL